MSDRLLHTKVSKRKPLTHFPKKEDGHDGDMQIVSIQGKGTYLCIKDKSEWKISEKFNPKNKFDTHIFDEITTRKIRGKGGLAITVTSEQIVSSVFNGKAATLTTSLTSAIRIGDGSNPGIITSNKEQDLILKTGNLTTAKIVMTDGANGGITSTLNGTGTYDIVWNSSDASSGEFALLNQSDNLNSGVRTNHQVSNTRADAYSGYTFLHDTAASSIHWVAGMDGSADGDHSMYKINYASQEASITPSSGTNVLSVSKEGNTSTAGTLTIGSIAPDTAGDNYLVEVSGVVKKRTPAETLADIGAQATVTAGTNCTFSGTTLNVDDAFVKNDASDTMAGTLTISGGDINIAATQKLYLDGGTETYLWERAADHMVFVSGGDYMLQLDEANDKVVLGATNWVAGTVSGVTVTEFSATNSAYAGMVLGYTRLQGDVAGGGGTLSFEIQNSMTVEDASHEVTFKTPPSEKVEIEGTCLMNISSTDTRISVGLSDSSTYNKVGEQFEYDNVGVVFSDDEIDDHVITFKFVLEAAQLASVGSSNTFYIGFSTSGSTKTAYLAYGLRLPHNLAYHPFVLKATALPAAIEDGL